MTKQEAIANHRKMWRWIADETERRERKVEKFEYFLFMGIEQKNVPYNRCYCCQYVIDNGGLGARCTLCPLLWGTENDKNDTFCMGDGAFEKWWIGDDDWRKTAKLARQIAELPEREDINDEKDKN